MADAPAPCSNRLPWITASAALAAFVIGLIPPARANLLYERAAIGEGQLWRLWTGHLVHFGWPHLLIDTGLLLVVGWFAERRYPAFTRWGLLFMPLFISGCLYWLEPAMLRYGGLSAVNLGLLLYVATQGWQRNWTDWFWPAVIAAYVGELVFEYLRGGQGGGAIRFDDASVHVATGAHVASAVYALLALVWVRLRRKKDQIPPPSS